MEDIDLETDPPAKRLKLDPEVPADDNNIKKETEENMDLEVPAVDNHIKKETEENMDPEVPADDNHMKKETEENMDPEVPADDNHMKKETEENMDPEVPADDNHMKKETEENMDPEVPADDNHMKKETEENMDPEVPADDNHMKKETEENMDPEVPADDNHMKKETEENMDPEVPTDDNHMKKETEENMDPEVPADDNHMKKETEENMDPEVPADDNHIKKETEENMDPEVPADDNHMKKETEEKMENYADSADVTLSTYGNAHKVENPVLDAKIVKQIEYYFGDYNLPRDKFLQEEIKKDEGWITLETMMKFQRLALLSSEQNVIINAIKQSTLMEVSEDNLKIRRSTNRPLPLFDFENMKAETVKRTIYCKGFAKDNSVTLDHLLDYFEEFGPYQTVHMRFFTDKIRKTQGFKGSVLVVFATVEDAEAFMKMENVKYGSTTLLRMWYADYLAGKQKEFDDRVAKKAAKLEEHKKQEEEVDITTLPKGMFLHMCGLTEDTRREDVKEALGEEVGPLCLFIDFAQGKTEGFLRFKEENSNVEILSKLGEFKVKGVPVTLRLVEGEEEVAQLQKMADARVKSRQGGGGGRGGRGGRRGGRGGWRGKKRD